MCDDKKKLEDENKLETCNLKIQMKEYEAKSKELATFRGHRPSFKANAFQQITASMLLQQDRLDIRYMESPLGFEVNLRNRLFVMARREASVYLPEIRYGAWELSYEMERC